MSTPAELRSHSDISFSTELKATVLLGIGIGFSQLTQTFIGLTDTVMMAQLGPDALAAGSLVNSIILVLFLFCVGLLQATAPMMGTALGEGRYKDISTVLNAGKRLALILSFIISGFTVFLGYIFTFTGQQPEVVRLGSQFALWLIPGIWASLMLIMIRIYFTNMHDMAMFGLVSFLGILINGVANYIFMYGKYGFPAMGVKGCALSTSMTNIFMYLCLRLYISHRKDIVGELYSVASQPRSKELTKAIISLGFPIGFAILSEYLVFAGAGIILGSLGTDELVAFSVCLQWFAVFYMIPVGISHAATTRISLAIGEKNLCGIKRQALASICSVFVYGVLAWLFIALFDTVLVHLLLRNKSITKLAIESAEIYMHWTAALLLISSVVVVGAGILRGLRETRRPMLIIFLFYWVGSLGTALLLGSFLGPEGVWVGMVIGFTITSIGLGANLRSHFRNLPQILSNIQKDDEQILGINSSISQSLRAPTSRARYLPHP